MRLAERNWRILARVTFAMQAVLPVSPSGGKGHPRLSRRGSCPLIASLFTSFLSPRLSIELLDDTVFDERFQIAPGRCPCLAHRLLHQLQHGGIIRVAAVSVDCLATLLGACTAACQRGRQE